MKKVSVVLVCCLVIPMYGRILREETPQDVAFKAKEQQLKTQEKKERAARRHEERRERDARKTRRDQEKIADKEKRDALKQQEKLAEVGY